MVGTAALVAGLAATSFWAKIGSDIDGASAGERLGESVAISSNGLIMAVGGGSTGVARV